MFHKNSTVSFTGHRPERFGGYHEDSDLVNAVKSELRSKIAGAINLGYECFITGMALGVDTWAGEIVLEFQKEFPEVRLICAVPFAGQERMWPLQAKKRYWNLIDNASEVEIVSEGDYSREKMQVRNEWMVDNSAVVISVWDGTNGGTANCVRYAKSQKVKIWPIDPNDLKPT